MAEGEAEIPLSFRLNLKNKAIYPTRGGTAEKGKVKTALQIILCLFFLFSKQLCFYFFGVKHTIFTLIFSTESFYEFT